MIPNSSDNRVAMVVFAIGAPYSKAYNRSYRPSHERFAKKYSIPLVVIEEPVEITTKHPSWQKLVVFSHSQLNSFDKVLIVDADIFITRHADNPIDTAPQALWAAVNNNAYNLESYAKSDPTLYLNCPKYNRPSFVLNGGMFVIDRSYKEVLEHIFRTYPEQNCYEQGPLSYQLINDTRGIVLPPRFNTLVQPYLKAHDLTLSTILAMYHDNYFLHFAAGKHQAIFHFVKFFDYLPLKVRSIIKYVAKNTFIDRHANSLFTFGDRIIAFYRGRIKRVLRIS